MGKRGKTGGANKKHAGGKMKERRAHRERSKEEHLLRKQQKREKVERKEFEAKRYNLDTFLQQKLFKILRELCETTMTGRGDIVEIFQLLDQAYEIDIVDIEDGVMRERLERIFEILDGQIQKQEKNDGGFVYVKYGNKPLEPQLLKFLEKSKQVLNS